LKKHALLVGVEDYRDRMISRLNFAHADASALAERLAGRCGFDTIRLLVDESGEKEPLLVNIVTAIRDIASELRSDDLFLFFFAGHGVEKDGHGYLLASDSLQAYPEHSSLSLELLRKTFAHLSASERILLLDACRNSPDAGRADAANCMGDVISRDIASAARSRSASGTSGTTTALLSACRSGQRAYEWPDKGHGVFTHYLVEGLDGAAWQGEELEFDRLAEYAANQVRQWAVNTPGLPIPQEPWFEKFGEPNSILLAAGLPAPECATSQLTPDSSNSKPSALKSVARWWVVLDGQELGPMDNFAIYEGIRDGSISRDAECWREGMDQWEPMGTTVEWADALPPLRNTPRPCSEMPPTPKPPAQLPDFMEPVSDAQYASLGSQNAGSDAAQKRQKQWVEKGYPLEVVLSTRRRNERQEYSALAAALEHVDLEVVAEIIRKYPPARWEETFYAAIAAPNNKEMVMHAGRALLRDWDEESESSYTEIAFRLVPPGEFRMGASSDDSEASSDEYRQHKVTITSPIYVAKFPVTQQQWQSVMGTSQAHFRMGVVTEKGGFFKHEKRVETATSEHPVECVSWVDCHSYINRVHGRLSLELGKAIRLPTEAEWEYACRAGTTRSRYGNLDAIGWFEGNSSSKTHPVGQKSPNAWGLHDMIGNVWEWCEDTWHDAYKKAPSDGSAWVGGEDIRRVLRGGSWVNLPHRCRSSYRRGSGPENRLNNSGFRVVVDLK